MLHSPSSVPPLSPSSKKAAETAQASGWTLGEVEAMLFEIREQKSLIGELPPATGELQG